MTKKRGLFSWLGKSKKPQGTEEPIVEKSAILSQQSDAMVKDSAAAEIEPSVIPAPIEVLKVDTPIAEAFANHRAKKMTVEVQQDAVDESSVPVKSTPVIDETLADETEEVVFDGDVTADNEGLALNEASTTEESQAGFFARLKRGLQRTRQHFGSGFVALFKGKQIDDELFEELEEQLLIADVGVDTTTKLIHKLTESASLRQLKDAEALYDILRDEMAGILQSVEAPLNTESDTPFVILMVGVNGVGKTTTIGKLAKQFQAQGKSVMLAAGDTFRAAAVEQLQVWGERNDIPVIAQHTGADSASVLYDALESAKARGVDVLIADTAGRLQNKAHLMDELKKVVRVMKKLDPQAPHEVMLTIDAGTGQNAISQTKLFNEAVGLTGITLTKLDGTAKGGVIFAIADQFKLPIRYLGVGEGINDLRSFEAGAFVDALFGDETQH